MNKTPIKNLPNDVKQNIIDSYNLQNISTVKIAKNIGYSSVAVRNFLISAGVKIKSLSRCHRKYNINENYFDKIDSESKAYFLGFLYADGYLHIKKGLVNLQLQDIDKEILIKLSKELEFDKPLLHVKSSKYNPNTRDSYRLVITNQKIFKRLLELGLYQKKSLTLKFPTSEQVPDHLIHHFIRGYFDGDGSQTLYYPKRKNKINTSLQSDIKILSTIEFIKSCIDKLKKSKCDVNFLINKRFKDKVNCYNLVVSGNVQVLKFMEFIYKDSSIFLERKMERFCKFVKLMYNKKQCKGYKYIADNLSDFKGFLDGKEIEV